MSAKGIGRGARTALGALLLAAGAAGALAACGHYGPPLRAAEYREAEEAEKAAERERAAARRAPAVTPADEGTGATPAPEGTGAAPEAEPGEAAPEGLEAPAP